jgi:prepilin-type processing-associated H-X9-DG protein
MLHQPHLSTTVLTPSACSLPAFFSSQIIAILAAILFPVFAKARDKALATACLSNTKQLALALQMYAQDYDQRLPFLALDNFRACWPEFVQPYVKNETLFQCPSWPMNPRTGPSGFGGDRIASGYGANYPHVPYRPGLPANPPGLQPWVQSLPELNYPAEQAYAADVADRYVYVPGDLAFAYCPFCFGYLGGIFTWGCLANRHNEGLNAVFFDGHAKWMKRDRVTSDTPEARRFWIHTN